MSSTKWSPRWLVVLLVAVGLVGAACGGNSSNSSNSSDRSGAATDFASLTGTLDGSGATFPKIFYEDAIAEFASVAPDLTVNYNAVGSGQGKKDLAAGTSAWAGSDSLVAEADRASFKGPFLYFPTVAAPITVAYNLDGVPSLRLSPTTLARIFMGAITSWGDPAISADNPGVTLPSTAITVAVRSDGSGTTSNFSKYLAAAAPSDFTVTAGDTVAWPRAQAGKGNTGVAQIVKTTAGAIGYVDLADARASSLTTASIRNRSGAWVAPTLAGATAALANAVVKDDLTYSALDAVGADSYPITAGTYVLVYATPAADAAALRGWLTYLLTDGQALAPAVDFAPLPEGLRERALAQVGAIGG